MFWIRGTKLSTLDLETFKKAASKIQSPVKYLHSCKISNNEFFFINQSASECCTLNIDTSTIRKLSNFNFHGWGATVYCDNFVYVLGGSYATALKYDLSSRRTLSIPTSPVSSRETVGSNINGLICLSGSSDENIYAYDPITEQYQAVYKVDCGKHRVLDIIT
jgi:hypothetical protein